MHTLQEMYIQVFDNFETLICIIVNLVIGQRHLHFPCVLQYFACLYSLDLLEKNLDRHVWIRASLGANTAKGKNRILLLAQGEHSVQASMLKANGVSKELMSWAGSRDMGSEVLVYGLVVKTKKDVKNASIRKLEIHVEQIYASDADTIDASSTAASAVTAAPTKPVSIDSDVDEAITNKKVKEEADEREYIG